MKRIFNIFLYFIIISTTLTVYAGENIIFTSNKKDGITVQVPTNSHYTPSTALYKGLYATGKAAEILTSGIIIEDNPNNTIKIEMKDIIFLLDNDNKRIGGIYPLYPYKEVYITALHLLKNSHFENEELKNYHFIGFYNDNTNSLFDVALIVKDLSNPDLQEFLNNSEGLKPQRASIYLNHLNLIDQNQELILTHSESSIITYNENYLFFPNKDLSYAGPSSSGAILYDKNRHHPLGSVICLSKMNNESKTGIIRSLSFSSLNKNNLVVLTQEKINSFQPLNCQNYDGRRGGGD